MSLPRPDPERVWIQFACAALGGAFGDTQNTRGLDWHSIDEALIHDAARAADLMMDQWRERFPK